METSRGLRNKNPLNIRINKDKFVGEVLPSTDTAFKQFISMAYGYRAAFVTLATYHKRGRDTIQKIIEAWAPANENNTEGYIAKVEKWSGIDRSNVLFTEGNKDKYIKIVAAMSRVENGVVADLSDVTKGFELQTKLK